jgi:HK97 gp10 family phage protein
MPESISIDIHNGEIELLSHEGFVRDTLNALGDEVANVARSIAPVYRKGPSHGGALSIHATTGQNANGYYVDVTWDAAHGYMRFPNAGTRYQEAQRFMERALESVIGGLL